MRHELKTWPSPFQAVHDMAKHCEVRRNDRNYRVGDELLLREWRPSESDYSGRALLVNVTHIVAGGMWGLPDDLCVMSIEIVQEMLLL